MIPTDHNNLNRQLYIELLSNLWLEFDLLKLQTTSKPGAGNILQQPRNLGIARQLAQKSTKGLFHFSHLRLVGIEVCGLKRLGRELLFKRDLFRPITIEHHLQILEIKIISKHQRNDEQ